MPSKGYRRRGRLTPTEIKMGRAHIEQIAKRARIKILGPEFIPKHFKGLEAKYVRGFAGILKTGQKAIAVYPVKDVFTYQTALHELGHHLAPAGWRVKVSIRYENQLLSDMLYLVLYLVEPVNRYLEIK